MNKSKDDEELTVNQRLRSFKEIHDAESKRLIGLPLSTHGLLIQYDIQRAFLAGAWISVIVLSQAAIEATIRDIETNNYESKAKALFGDNIELQRIRNLRNEIVHPLPPESPSLVWSVPNGDFAACHAFLEKDAKIAVKHMFRIMYSQKQT